MKPKVRRAARAKERRAANARRRAAMFWMLREAGASYVEMARAAGLFRSRVHQICQSYALARNRSWSASAALGRSWVPPRQGGRHLGCPIRTWVTSVVIGVKVCRRDETGLHARGLAAIDSMSAES